MNAPHFSELRPETPRYDEVAAQYGDIEAAFHRATSDAEREAAVLAWDAIRRELATWSAWTDLVFSQDTTSEPARQARNHLDELRPRLTDLDVRIKRLLLGSPHRPALEARFGSQAFALWDTDVLAFDPAIQDDLVEESRLEAEYTALCASARLPFRGEQLTLSTIRRWTTHPDRDTRHEAEQVRWAWFRDNGDQLDRIYDDLVRVRTRMARTLGHENYIPLGYRRMQRIDYDRNDVERFRDEVRAQVVPLATEERARQARRLGVDAMRFWDEGVSDPAGNPAPKGDHDWMVQRAIEMFDTLDPRLGAFFRMMVDRGLIDLDSRDGKAGGGFCTSFPTTGLPFIFANFNGTKGDVEVFTHEMGHAFQCWRSRDAELLDYVWPTMESCEIHSMSLEFLTWPQMERFFGDDAERFRRIHLTESTLFIPYGVAVDHFQHLVYANPDATPAERHRMWQEVESMYLPWRQWGDLERPAQGGFWQHQRHIYASPFYYIDYTLAQTCALQFWLRADRDFAGTLDAYVALCDRGGSMAFQGLARSADLISPFEPGCLRDVVSKVRAVLES